MQCEHVSIDVNAIWTTPSQIVPNTKCTFTALSHIQQKSAPYAQCQRQLLYSLYGWFHSSTYRLEVVAC